MEKLAEGYGLVEGPLWDPVRGLIFSDVLFGGVFCLCADGTVETVFEHRRGIGGIVAHERGGLVVSGRNISFKPFDGETRILLDRDMDNGNVGYNDITTDAQGRIYAGSLGNSPVFEDDREPQSGDLYMIDLDGSSSIVGEDVMLTNGLGFSPDGSTLYHADSTRRVVNCYDVNGDGTLGAKRVFAEVERGAPDGLAVSVDGRVWVALAGGGHGVGVFAPDGTMIDHVGIPQPMCTSLCFGGPDLSELFVVSGSDGMDSDRAGAIYRFEPDTTGVPVVPARVAVD